VPARNEFAVLINGMLESRWNPTDFSTHRASLMLMCGLTLELSGGEAVRLDDWLGLNRDVCKFGSPKHLYDLAYDWLCTRNLVFAKDLLHESAVALKHDVPLTVVGAARFFLGVASHAHKIGSALILHMVGPAEVLHANNVCVDAGFRQRRHEPPGKIFAKAAVVDEVRSDD